MVQREDQDGLLVISQPAHAWLAGQLARHWGNDAFGDFQPREEVCLAAEQHDLGFLDWERQPTLDARTGRPHDFRNMPTPDHVAAWSTSVLKAMEFNRYTALLVSLHVTGLAQRHTDFKTAREAEVTQGFLDQQHAIQTMLLAALREDPHYAAFAADENVARNRQLVAAWDWMSLLLCGDLAGAHVIEGVPARNGAVNVTLQAVPGSQPRVTVNPWPFSGFTVKLVCEGRRLAKQFASEPELRAARREAPAVPLTFLLSAN